MNELPRKLQDRADKKARKRDEKKRQIAESALEALKELGYANTSLRDIAEKCDLSLGMLHYYFEDRTDLIIYCVRVYKEEFVKEFMDALAHVSGPKAVVEAFAEELTRSIFDDEMTHRLWYDIRTQAMFDATFRRPVAEIEEKLIDIVRTAYVKAGRPVPENIAMHYAMIEGVFRYVMQENISRGGRSRQEVKGLFVTLLSSYL